MLSSYLTIKKEGSAEIIIQKSRFIGYVKRVETEEQAQSFVQDIKKRHHNATHNCSAYIIGEHDQIQKANDDGEPSGTAGLPILEVLKTQNSKESAVVVTPYFGGIKLLAGGLIRAYRNTTSETIRETGVVRRQLMQGFSITVDYSLLGKFENILRNSEHILKKINYLDTVEFIVYVKNGEEDTFQEWMVDLSSDQADVKELNQAYVEIDVEAN